jgi:hypothetical protein
MAAAGQYASSAGRSVSTGAQRAAASATPNWVYWAIPALVVAGLLWYLLADHTTQVAERPTVVPPQTQNVVVSGVDVGKQINDSLGTLRTSLASITDAASATAALPKLQEATAQIDKVAGTVKQLPADQRRVADGLVASSMETVNQLFDKVLAIPGVAECCDIQWPGCWLLRSQYPAAIRLQRKGTTTMATTIAPHDWATDVKRYVANADNTAVKGIVKHLGIALQSPDASFVACADKSERDRVRESFLKKKLALSLPDTELDQAILEVCQRMKADRDKSRVAFYYLLAEKYNKLSLFSS